jgi:hypothetical protein
VARLRIHMIGGQTKELSFANDDDARRYLQEIRSQARWILLKEGNNVVGQIPVSAVSLIELVADD